VLTCVNRSYSNEKYFFKLNFQIKNHKNLKKISQLFYMCARGHTFARGVVVGCDPFILFLNVLPSIFQTCFVTRPFCKAWATCKWAFAFCRAPFFSLLLLFAADMLLLRRGELSGVGGMGLGLGCRTWVMGGPKWVGG